MLLELLVCCHGIISKSLLLSTIISLLKLSRTFVEQFPRLSRSGSREMSENSYLTKQFLQTPSPHQQINHLEKPDWEPPLIIELQAVPRNRLWLMNVVEGLTIMKSPSSDKTYFIPSLQHLPPSSHGDTWQFSWSWEDDLEIIIEHCSSWPVLCIFHQSELLIFSRFLRHNSTDSTPTSSSVMSSTTEKI